MPVTNVRSRWVAGVLEFYNPVDDQVLFKLDGPNKTVTIPSGATLSLADSAIEAGDLGLAEGSVFVGSSAAKAAALSAKTSGRILVGDGTTVASVAVSGDATLASSGAMTIAANAVTTAKVNDAAITSAKLANGAGVAALLTAGLGASASYVRTTNGAQTVLASDGAARVALIQVIVDTTFADGDGTQPTFEIGETDTTDKYAATTVFTGATAGDVFFFAGTLTAAKALLATAVAATGATSTGALSVTALVLPAAA